MAEEKDKLNVIFQKWDYVVKRGIDNKSMIRMYDDWAKTYDEVCTVI